MTLSCDCDYDYEFDAGDWYYDYNLSLDQIPLDTKRRVRCCSCNKLINIGDLCNKYSRVRYPYSDIEAKIRCGCNLEDSLQEEAIIRISPDYHCERCGEIWLNLTDAGYECLNPRENMESSLNEYWELAGFDPAKYKEIA